MAARTISKVAHRADSDGRPPWRLRPWPWLLLLTLAGITYALAALLFSATVADWAGGLALSPVQLQAMAEGGRLLGALGFALVCLDRLPWRWTQRPWSALASVVLVALLAWLLLYQGQRYLVDQRLVLNSSAEQRQAAYHAALVQRGLVHGGWRIEPAGDAILDGAVASPLLPWLGWLAYRLPGFGAPAGGLDQAAVDALVDAEQAANLAAHYRRYRAAVAAVERRWEKYQQLSENYLQDRTYIDRRVDDLWSGVELRLVELWQQYQDRQRATLKLAQERAGQWAQPIYLYLDARADCIEPRCRERLDQRYQRDIKPLGYGTVDPGHWYKNRAESEIERQVQAQLALRRAEVAVAGPGAAGEATSADLAYTNDVDHYAHKLLLLEAPAFVQQSGGYELAIEDLALFRDHRVTRQRLRSYLARQGVVLDSRWSPDDTAAFRAAAVTMVEGLIVAEWRDNITSNGIYIPPDLLYAEFIAHPRTHELLRQALGSLYVAGMGLDWSSAQFRQRVLEPLAMRQKGTLLAPLNAAPHDFADGGVYQQLGQQSLGGVLLPVFAIGVNLLLAVLLVVLLPLQLQELGRIWKARKRPWLGKTRPDWRYGVALALMMLTAVTLLPLMVATRSAPADAQPGLFASVAAQSGGGASLALAWFDGVRASSQPLLALFNGTLMAGQELSLTEP